MIPLDLGIASKLGDDFGLVDMATNVVLGMVLIILSYFHELYAQNISVKLKLYWPSSLEGETNSWTVGTTWEHNILPVKTVSKTYS